MNSQVGPFRRQPIFLTEGPSIVRWVTAPSCGQFVFLMLTLVNSIPVLHYCMAGPALGASLLAQLVKNPSAMQETPVQFLGQEDLLEKG